VGRRIHSQGDSQWIQVVGVVSDTKVASLGEPPTPLLYFPMGAAGATSLYFIVRTAGDPSAILTGLRAGVRTVNADLPVDQLGTLSTHLGTALASARLSAGLLGLFSVLALVLASVGIYTIVSFSVAGRMPEIGIRVALGAERGRVIRMVVGEVALTVGIGLAAGTTLVLVANARLGPSVGGGLEPGTLGAAAAIMALAVGVAAWLPARRAAAVDPVEALRGG
jgi:ABC-type antimicrobial peptide transport system permease subunit